MSHWEWCRHSSTLLTLGKWTSGKDGLLYLSLGTAVAQAQLLRLACRCVSTIAGMRGVFVSVCLCLRVGEGGGENVCAHVPLPHSALQVPESWVIFSIDPVLKTFDPLTLGGAGERLRIVPGPLHTFQVSLLLLLLLLSFSLSFSLSSSLSPSLPLSARLYPSLLARRPSL